MSSIEMADIRWTRDRERDRERPLHDRHEALALRLEAQSLTGQVSVLP